MRPEKKGLSGPWTRWRRWTRIRIASRFRSVWGRRRPATLVRADDVQRLAGELARAGATIHDNGPDSLIVRGMDIDQVGDRAFTAGIALHELSPHAGSLEELFLQWTNQSTTEEDIAS